MTAFRLNILANNSEDEELHAFSGAGKIRIAPHVKCPNCCLEMFPAINFRTVKFGLYELFGTDFVSVPFCPSCAHHLEPYWVRQRTQPEIVGGYRDSGDILVSVDRPFVAREIEFREISDSHYSNANRENFLRRTAEEGVYHQVGGEPLRGIGNQMHCCDCGVLMRFAGILDSDDLNVPLYENGGVPFALSISDNVCLNIYSCGNCSIIGLCVAR